jgi:F0F1-type ATP synthase assembly protein I
MKQETVSTQKPEKTMEDLEQDARNRSIFMGAALSMSWQLAIVVLLPIIGGHMLDTHLHSLPLYTILGFVVAVLGAGVVVWKQAIAVSPKLTTSNDHKDQQK